MATKDELITTIESKIDVTGRRLTTGVKTRAALEAIVDAMFEQFGQIFTTTVNLSANVDKVIVIPSATYQGDIRTINIWDASGNEITRKLAVIKGTSGSDKTLTLNSPKVDTNVEVNITMR